MITRTTPRDSPCITQNSQTKRQGFYENNPISRHVISFPLYNTMDFVCTSAFTIENLRILSTQHVCGFLMGSEQRQNASLVTIQGSVFKSWTWRTEDDKLSWSFGWLNYENRNLSYVAEQHCHVMLQSSILTLCCRAAFSR
jgi:hypothetical protein